MNECGTYECVKTRVRHLCYERDQHLLFSFFTHKSITPGPPPSDSYEGVMARMNESYRFKKSHLTRE